MSSHDNSLEASDSTADLTHAVAGMTLTPPPPAHAATATAPCLAPTTTSTAAPPVAISTAAGSSHPASTTTAQPTTAPATAQDRSTATASDPITWERVQAVKAAHGLDHSRTIIVYGHYTQHLAASGRRDEAITVLQAAVQEASTTLAPDHKAAVDFGVILAQNLQAAGQHQAAMVHLEWLLPRIKSLYGPQSHPTMTVLCHVSQGLLLLGRPAEALSPAEQAYILALLLHGRADYDTFSALRLVLAAHADTHTCPPSAACQHAEQLLKLHRRTRGHWDDVDLHTGSSLFLCYRNVKDNAANFKFLPDLVAGARQLHGDGSEKHLMFLRARAVNAADCGKHAQSVSLFQHLLHIRKTQHGQQHKSTIQAAAELGEVYLAARRDEDAVQVFQQAWLSAKAGLDSQDRLSVRVFAKYMQALQSTGRVRAGNALALDAKRWGLSKAAAMAWCAEYNIPSTVASVVRRVM